MAAELEVQVPDIGDFKDVPVIEILVQPGDTITVDMPVIVLETDKAVMEVPSSVSGVVGALAVKVGDRVNRGDRILSVVGQGTPTASAPPPSETPMSPVKAEVIATSAAPPPPSASNIVTVPDIGDFKDVPVIEILVKVGDTVSTGMSLMVLESDKAVLEVPSPADGIVERIDAKIGDRLNRGDRLLSLHGSGSTDVQAEAAPTASTATVVAAAVASDRVTSTSAKHSSATIVPTPANSSPDMAATPAASPAIRKFARELGVELNELTGTGPRGRILREDVERFVRQALPKARAPAAEAAPVNGAFAGMLPWPNIDFTKFGSIERQPLVRLRKISGANLSRNWVMIPHVTNFDEADITELEAFRQQINREVKLDEPKLTMLAFLIKASVEVLRRFPEYNASLDGDELVLKRYFHIGFAADTPNGLVVPVIRDADRKGLREIAKECGELAALARASKLKPEHMQGGCFTISSLGGIGGTGFTPIINAPEVAILGVTRSELKPKWDGTQFQPRLMLPLNLSWDHRVVDGASAARFLVTLCSLLSDFRRICL